MEPELVTIHCNEKGVRVGIVTPHGPEDVEPSLEERLLAVSLWHSITRQPLKGHVALVPELEMLLDKMAHLCQSVTLLLGSINNMTHALNVAASKVPEPVSPPPYQQ